MEGESSCKVNPRNISLTTEREFGFRYQNSLQEDAFLKSMKIPEEHCPAILFITNPWYAGVRENKQPKTKEKAKDDNKPQQN